MTDKTIMDPDQARFLETTEDILVLNTCGVACCSRRKKFIVLPSNKNAYPKWTAEN